MRLAAEALLAVKAAPHDTANVLADWNAGFGVGDGGPCNWSMVACSKAGHMDGSTGMPRWASARFLGYDIDLSHTGSDDLRALRRGAGDGVHDARQQGGRGRSCNAAGSARPDLVGIT